MDAVVLQRPDHLETGAVADVREARIFVAPEVALENTAVLRPIEQRAPRFQLAHAIRGLRWACSSAIRQLFTYWPPRIVSAKCTFQLSRSSTFASAAAMPPSAMTVCALPSNDLQMRPTRLPASRRFDRRAQSRAACADDQDIMFKRLERQRILQSVSTPIEQRRT